MIDFEYLIHCWVLVVIGAWCIKEAVKNYRNEHFYTFGLWVMWTIYFIVTLIRIELG